MIFYVNYSILIVVYKRLLLCTDANEGTVIFMRQNYNYNYMQLTDMFNYLNFHVSHIFHRSLDSSWRFDNHCHNFNRLYFILDGQGYLYNSKERVDLLPNNIYLIPANSCYNYRCDDYMEKIFIHFNLTVVPQKDLLSNIDRILTFPTTPYEMEYMRGMFENQDIKSAMFLQNYIRALVFDVLEPYSEEISHDIEIYKKYSLLYQYINDHLYADISIADACRYVGFSQAHIGRLFKADTGQTIKEYVTVLIMEKLKYKLLYTKKTIKEIASELRFADEFYLSKFFKKHIGCSPREFRNRHNASSEK